MLSVLDRAFDALADTVEERLPWWLSCWILLILGVLTFPLRERNTLLQLPERAFDALADAMEEHLPEWMSYWILSVLLFPFGLFYCMWYGRNKTPSAPRIHARA